MCFHSTLPLGSRRSRPHLLLPGLILAAAAGASLGFYSRIQLSTPLHAVADQGLRIVLASAPFAAPAGPIPPSPPPIAPVAAQSAVQPGGQTGLPSTTTPATTTPQLAGGPQARIEASFDCAEAVGAAETQVCADPRLAAADRRMARAWHRALDAGAPAWRLKRDQRDWLAARDAAARESPGDLADLYAQRISELEALGPGAAGPEY